MSFGVYFGPYLKVPLYPKEEQVTTYRCSANCGCTTVNKTTRYCPNCGQPVVVDSTPNQVTVVPMPWSLSKAFDEDFWVPESAHATALRTGYATWMPNKRGFGNSFTRDTGPQEVEVSDRHRADQLSKAASAWAPAIADAEARFGVKLELSWGLVAYEH